MKKSMLGLALSALFATASFAQTATPVVQPPAPAVMGNVVTESAAPQVKATKKTKKTAKKTKKAAKKASISHTKHTPKLSAKVKKHKLQA